MSLADFRVVGKIGEGAYSSVHKVMRLSDNKQYALKKVRLNLLKEKEKQNSLNEVRILASIENPYIVSYKDAFIDDNNLCIVMEYAEGGDIEVVLSFTKAKIRELQRKRTHMNEREVWKLISHSLQGLQALHELKIMHRDMKSANIFISNGCYKLGDLNVSKIVKNKLAYTQTGTPYYASPEVWRDEPYDSKSDIWSFGCVIYQVCALHPPFQAKDMEGLFRRVQRGIFDRIPKHFSNQLQKFIELCLQLNPQKRSDCRGLLLHPSLKQYNQTSTERQNNLLQTIRMPKNIHNLKQRLPKSKYESDVASERQRVPSQNSDVINRYRTDSSGNNQNFHVNNHYLPSLIQQIQPKQRKAVHSMIDDSKKSHLSQLIVLKPQDPETDNRLKDILREKQKIRELIQLKEKMNRQQLVGSSLPPTKKPLSRLIPMSSERKVEEYSRPHWWG